MPVTLRDVTDVSSVQEFRPETAVRAKHGHAQIAVDNVLPFISVGMPVQLAERAGFKVENNASQRRRDWKARRVDAPFATTFEHAMRRLGKHPKFVRLRGSYARTLQIFRYLLRRNRAPSEVNLLAWKAVKRCLRQPKIFRQQRFGRVADPIGNAERAELGEITVVENQNEMCWFIPEAFEHVSVATRKIPNVARIKVVRLALPGRIDHGGAHTTLQHKRPFRSRGVPVQLAHHAGFKLHRDARDSFRDRQLLDSYFLAKTVPENSPLRFLQFEFERRQFFPRQHRVRNIVSKTVIAHQSAFFKALWV